MKTNRKSKIYTYSPMEQGILDVLLSARAGTRFTINDFIEKVYPEGQAPFTARQTVMYTAKMLIQKVDANGEKFIIMRTEGAGSANEFWREVRK